MPRVSVNRRAHFPVGGKRNTLNFFGHGNRPKKKGKTAAEEDDDDDDQPTRRSRHSDHWILTAAVGSLGAAGTYWAFTHPKEVREAARTLGVEDTPVIKQALDFITGGTPESRQAQEQALARRAEAEHGAAAKVPTAQDPATRTPARALNAQEADIVEFLKDAGHDKEAKFFTEHVTALPDSGPLEIPKTSHDLKDPVAAAGAFLAARQRYDEFRVQVEHETLTKATQGGQKPSEAELNHARERVPVLAKHRYQEWVEHPESILHTSFAPKPGEQAPGEGGVQDALVTEQIAELQHPGDHTLGDPATTAQRNLEAQANLASTSRPASSVLGAIGMGIDRPEQTLIGNQSSMLVNQFAGQYFGRWNQRGLLGNETLHSSQSVQSMAAHSKAILEISQAREAALKAGDYAKVRELDAQALPGVPTEQHGETFSEISDAAGKAADLATTTMATRTLARSVTPKQIGLGGAVVGTVANAIGGITKLIRDPESFKWKDLATQEAGVAQGVGTQAAMNWAARRGLQNSNALAGVEGSTNFPVRAKGPGTLGEQLAAEPAEIAKIRAGVQAEVDAIPASEGMLARFGTRLHLNTVGVGKQLKWTFGSISSPEAVAAQIPKLTEAGILSPALKQILRVNALRTGVSFASSTASLGTLISGGQAVFNLGEMAVGGQDFIEKQQYERALKYTLENDGRIEEATGLQGAAPVARTYGHTAGHVVMGDVESVQERYAALQGYGQTNGANSPSARGVRDGMFAVMNRNMLAKAMPVANQLVDGDPMWARASIDQRSKMAEALASSMASEEISRFKDAPMLVQDDLDRPLQSFDAKLHRFHANPLAAADSSGSGLVDELTKLRETLLPPGKYDTLHDVFKSGGLINAAKQEGVDVGEAIRSGHPEELMEPAARFSDRNIHALKNAPGAIGNQYKVYDQVYGRLKMQATRALGAPEFRNLPGDAKRQILNSVMKKAESTLRPVLEAHIKANSQDADLSKFTQKDGALDGVLKQNGWDRLTEKTSLSGGGQAETAFAEADKILRPLMDPQDAQKLLDPASIHAAADRATGMTFEQRNNSPETGLYTAASPQGLAMKARDEAWAKDLEASGIKLPQDQAGMDRFLAKARSQGVDMPTRYENQGAAGAPENAQNVRGYVGIEMGANGQPRWVVRNGPTTETMNQGQSVAVLRALSERNPDLFQQLSQNSQKTPITSVLLAQERPGLEKALAAPGGGFTKMGPNGAPAGIAGTWEDLRADISANPQNYNKAWRPEVQTYIGDWNRYHGLKTQPGMVPTPEVEAELDTEKAYNKFVSSERDAWRKTQPEPSAMERFGQGMQMGTPDGMGMPSMSLPPVPVDTFKPSMTAEQFASKFHKDPTPFLGQTAKDWWNQSRAHEKRIAELKAPAFTRSTAPYPVTPAQPVVKPAPAVTPTPGPAPIGQPTVP